MNPVLALVIFLCIFGALTYTILILKKRPDQKWNWFHTFVATMVSVLSAFAIGILLFEMQSYDDEQISNKAHTTGGDY